MFAYRHLTGYCSKPLQSFVHSYIETVHYLWSEEQRQLDEEKRLSSSIFRHETSDLESEQDLVEYQRLFPSFDKDFLEFLPAETSLPEENISSEEKPRNDPVLPYDLLYEYLSSIMSNRTRSLDDVLPPFFNSLYEFGQDDRLITHFIRLAIPSKETLAQSVFHSNKPFDIYRDSKPSMIVESHSMVQCVEDRTRFLLLTHENHPTLLEILLVLQRLKSFSIEHSLVKFLYGFDILFDKLTYWQQTYASKSLQTTFDDELTRLTSIIVQYRQFEFNSFADSLSMIDFDQRRRTINQWWLHLFAIINAKESLPTEFEQNLRHFFRQSTLGDFRTRLEICQLLIGYFQNENSALVHSIVKYYEQFSDYLQKEADTIRKPIEKEIKQFFRIQQWKDTNYYSLKQSIDKSHRFLFKSMKKYKQSLAQPIDKFLPRYEIAADRSLNKNDEFFRLIRVRFNEKFFPLRSVPMISQSKFDTQSIGQLCSNISAMKSQTKDRKEIKQLYTEKRQLITQLFKKLTSIGLAFRKGLLNLSSQTSFIVPHTQFQFVAFQSTSTYGSIETRKNKLLVDNRCETLQKFAVLFKQTDDDFYRIEYQYGQIRLLAQKNTLDPIIYQRIQGFNEHLIKIISQQKLLFQSFIQQYGEFSRLFSLYSKQDFQIPPMDDNHIDRLYHSTVCLIERIESFRLILRSVPSSSSSSSPDRIPLLDRLPHYIPLIQSHDLNGLLDSFLQRLNLLMSKVNQHYDQLVEHHPILNEILGLHSEIVSSQQQIRNVISKVFLDEKQFPQDQFLGESVKSLLQIFEEFSQINILKDDKGQRRLPYSSLRPSVDVRDGETRTLERAEDKDSSVRLLTVTSHHRGTKHEMRIFERSHNGVMHRLTFVLCACLSLAITKIGF